MAGAGDVPEELLCPLTHELLIDPVMTEDGHTYERAVLERWLSSHKPQQRSAHRTVVADPIRAGRVAPCRGRMCSCAACAARGARCVWCGANDTLK